MAKSDLSSLVVEEECSSQNQTRERNQTGQIPNRKIAIIDCEKRLEDVLVQPTFSGTDPNVVAKQILEAFNQHADKNLPCFTTSLTRGSTIGRNEFMIGNCNKIPQLHGYSGGTKIARCLYPGSINTTAEINKIVDITDRFYGIHGSYVLNVPQNKYARCYSWNIPKLYAPGIHVIHDTSFSFDSKNGFVDQNVSHIQHGNINILYVPTGKIATIRIGATNHILDSRSTPYIFDHPLFSLIIPDKGDLFYDSSSEWLIHGSIKRLIIPTGKVAVTYNNGILEILEPSQGSRPIIIDSETHKFSQFLDITVQTLQFPSEATKIQRKKDRPHASAEENSYEIFTTRDSLKVGVKLLVAYRISDPYLAISSLSIDGLLPHVENLAVTDMAKAISQSSSQEFLSFYQTKPIRSDPISRQGQDIASNLNSNVSSNVEPPLMHFQDIVKHELAKDLNEYGIELLRLNVESPEIIDKSISSKMSEQALRSAEANAQESVLVQQRNIAEQTAMKEARMLTIKTEQENQSRVLTAAAELEAARNRADAILIEARAAKEANQLKAESWESNPKLFEIEMHRISADAIAKSQFLVSAQMGAIMGQRTNYSPFDLMNNINGVNGINGASITSAISSAISSAQSGQRALPTNK